MSLPSKEAVGVRYTGWAALDRDPQEDLVEYNCPYCGERGMKSARRTTISITLPMGFYRICGAKWRRAIPAAFVADRSRCDVA